MSKSNKQSGASHSFSIERRDFQEALSKMGYVPMEFLRRFPRHVLPSRFCKVRHYGPRHNSKRATIKLLQAAMSFAPGRDLPKPVAIEKPPAMTCPKYAAVMTFEKRYNRSQRLKHEMALPRGPPQ